MTIAKWAAQQCWLFILVVSHKLQAPVTQMELEDYDTWSNQQKY